MTSSMWGGLACLEICCRRIQAFMGAYSGGQVKWSAAKFFVGGIAPGSTAISPGLRQYVSRRAKEEQQLEHMRSRTDRASASGHEEVHEEGAAPEAPAPNRQRAAAPKRQGPGRQRRPPAGG